MSTAPAWTPPGPRAAPAIVRSSAERFCPGMIVSAKASMVSTV
jgi:hypothetical protein